MSTTTLTSDGQVPIPDLFRKALHLHPGDKVLLTLEGGKLVLEPDVTGHATLIEENGRKVLVAPPGAQPMTPDAIKAILADSP